MGTPPGVPALLYLVFEAGGQVHAFERLEEAADSLDSTDLRDGNYRGA
jgi:hypothetical protein